MDIASHVVKFNSQTAGRDKLCRLVSQLSPKQLWTGGQVEGAWPSSADQWSEPIMPL